MTKKKVEEDNQAEEIDESRQRIIDDFKKFVNEFKGESDRAAVILGASKLDQLLGMILKKYLLPCPNSTDELFSNNGPLGSFSAKIDICYRLGLIDASFCKSIHLTRKIRNSFAHEVYGASLNNGSHKDRIKSLVSLIKDYEWFSVLKSGFFDGVEDSRADFSTALGLMIVRLEGLLYQMEPLPGENPRAMIPPKYNKRLWFKT